MATLITIRHGQSAWNLENRFTGETDVDLTPAGRLEATRAGKALRGRAVDLAFTSVLKRAIETLDIVLAEMSAHPPIARSRALNERNYGDLQGLNKAETEARFGKDQVHIWRRSYSVRPPGGESLEDTYHRVLPYYIAEIEPQLKSGKNILVVAHGNSLRALMMHLERIGPDQIPEINIPTGVPRIYSLDSALRVTHVDYLEIQA